VGLSGQRKILGAWSIPKGEFEPEENPLAAAKRELEEETGIKAEGDFMELTPVKQKSGKLFTHGLYRRILMWQT
jgi:predicted NUDIX family NTP pyrophosphohydrolase